MDGFDSPIGYRSHEETGVMVVWSEKISNNEEIIDENMGDRIKEICNGSGDRSATEGLVRLRNGFMNEFLLLLKLDKSPFMICCKKC